MIQSNVFNYVNMLDKALDAAWIRNEVISNNIANVDTPGYKSKYVTFEDEFRTRLRNASMAKDGEKMEDAISGSHFIVHDTEEESTRLDESNVNADVESVELSRATLQYMYTAQAITSDIARLRSVITGQ